MDQSRRKLLVTGAIVGTVVVGSLLPTYCAMQRMVPKSKMTENNPPKRPPGQPKPLLEEDIAPVLARLDAWYAAHLRPDLYKFNPPAEEAELDAFERLIGVKLPKAYRQLYQWHDGDNEKDDRWGHIYGLPLLSLRGAQYEWKFWNELLIGPFGGDRYEIPGKGWPEHAVDPAYINPRWIPLTHDGSGNYIGLDFDPWPLGRVGQVIIYGTDEDIKVVLAQSLGTFLEWIADLLESGNFRLEAQADEEVLRLFRLKNSPSNHFHEGARILLGAPLAYS